MSRFSLAQPFEIVAGTVPIVVAAPHHGTRPNARADQGTGPVALALARQLEARAVVAHDLRSIVDVNKDPWRLGLFGRGYAVRYQNALFADSPQLVIEIHGHATGRYEVEISPGFDLDPALPADAAWIQKLTVLQESLARTLAAQLGRAPTIGIYPLNRDVAKTATDTFTFQKVRRGRNLAGLGWYGLHVELGPALRPGQQGQAQFPVEALAAALAMALRRAFWPLPPAGAILPVPAGADHGRTPLLSPRVLRLVRAPARYVEDRVLVLHPDELEALGALDGDTVVVRNGQEEIRVAVATSRTVRPGAAALPARMRNQVGVKEGGRVAVGRPAPAPGLATASPVAAVVVQVRPDKGPHLWLAAPEVERLHLEPGNRVPVQGQPPRVIAETVRPEGDPNLRPRMAAVSSALAKRLVLTLGETVLLGAADSFRPAGRNAGAGFDAGVAAPAGDECGEEE